MTSQAQPRGQKSVYKTYAKRAQVNRADITLEMIARGSYRAHSLNRIKANLTQAFAVTCRGRLTRTVVNVNQTQ